MVPEREVVVMDNLIKGEIALKIDVTNPLGGELTKSLASEEKSELFLQNKKIGSKLAVFAFTDEECSNTKRVGRLEEIPADSVFADSVSAIVKMDDVIGVLNDGKPYECLGISLFGSGMGHLQFREKQIAVPVADETVDGEAPKDNSKAGVCSRCKIQGADLDERIEYLASHGVTFETTPNEWICALDLMMSLSVNQEAKPDRLYVNTQKISPIRKVLLGLAQPNRRMTILEGEKSVGKNVCWESIGWLLNRPIEQNTYSSRTTAGDTLGRPMTKPTDNKKLTPEYAEEFIMSLKKESHLVGGSAFLAELSHNMAPNVELKQGALARALLTAEERGTIYIADEMNLSDANMFSSLFNTLTDSHSRWYDISGLGKIEISRNLIIGGTRNPIGFVGTNVQNAATMSRFQVVRIKSPESISELLEGANYNGIIAAPGVSLKTLIKNASDIYDVFAEAVRGKTVSDSCLNYRGFQAAIGEALAGIPLKDAIMDNVVYNAEDERSIPLLEDILETHLE